jgi:hypothetical protein
MLEKDAPITFNIGTLWFSHRRRPSIEQQHTIVTELINLVQHLPQPIHTLIAMVSQTNSFTQKLDIVVDIKHVDVEVVEVVWTIELSVFCSERNRFASPLLNWHRHAISQSQWSSTNEMFLSASLTLTVFFGLFYSAANFPFPMLVWEDPNLHFVIRSGRKRKATYYTYDYFHNSIICFCCIKLDEGIGH